MVGRRSSVMACGGNGTNSLLNKSQGLTHHHAGRRQQRAVYGSARTSCGVESVLKPAAENGSARSLTDCRMREAAVEQSVSADERRAHFGSPLAAERSVGQTVRGGSNDAASEAWPP